MDNWWFWQQTKASVSFYFLQHERLIASYFASCIHVPIFRLENLVGIV